MATVLFYNVPALSHYYSTFKIAKILKERNFDVIFFGSDIFKSVVEKSGFNFVSINEWDGQLTSEISKKGVINFLRDCICNLHDDTGYKRFKMNVNMLHEEILKVKPDLIFIDSLRALFFPVFKEFATRIVLISILPFSGKSDFIPPFYLTLVPKKNFLLKKYIELLWFKNKLIKLTSFHLNNFITLNQNISSYIIRFSKEIKSDLNRNLDYNRSYYYSVKNLPELILIPESFEFFHIKSPNIYYAGLEINRERIKEVNISNSRYIAVIELIKKLKIKNDNSKVIYCSLGTLTSADQNIAECFFKKITKVCCYFPEFIFILSTGDSYDPRELLPLPSNMFVFPYVPQTDLLLHTDIMITHGGINSILECIETSTPMLVYPFSLKWDQPGNSARVVYHGLGLKGKIRSDSPVSIAEKLSKLVSNYHYYKKNVLIMQNKFKKENNPDMVMKFVEKMIVNTK